MFLNKQDYSVTIFVVEHKTQLSLSSGSDDQVGRTTVDNGGYFIYGKI